MKNKKLIILLIILCSVLAVGLITFMILMMNNNFRISNIVFHQRVSKNLVLEKNYSTSFDYIDIYTSNADIEVMNSNDDQIHLKIYGENKKYKVVDDQKLMIELFEKKCIGFCFQNIISKVVIEIPDGYMSNIKIDNDYGDIKIGNLPHVKFDVIQDCGDFYMRKADFIQIKNSYGDIDIKEADKIVIDQDCGDTSIGMVKNLKIENNYGDIEIDKVLESVDIKEDCGDIEIGSLTLNKNSRIKNSYGDVEIKHTNQIYINAKTDFGDVDINHNYRKSNMELVIDNSCGDIEVDN